MPAIHLFELQVPLLNLINVQSSSSLINHRFMAQNKILAITNPSGKINSVVSLAEGASQSGKLVPVSPSNLDCSFSTKQACSSHISF